MSDSGDTASAFPSAYDAESQQESGTAAGTPTASYDGSASDPASTGVGEGNNDASNAHRLVATPWFRGFFTRFGLNTATTA